MHTLIPAVILRAIEDKYKSVEIHELFDCIGGTGFGAIVALGLIATKDDHTRFLDSQTLVDFFYKEMPKIFIKKDNKMPLYSAVNFKKVIQAYFNDMNLSDTLTRILIPCGTVNPSKPFRFDSLEAQKSLILKLTDCCVSGNLRR